MNVIAALESDTKRRESLGEEAPLHPNLCGPCPECSEFLNQAAKGSDEDLFWSTLGDPPHSRAIAAHARRFGREGMEIYGMGESRSRRPGRNLHAEVRDLLKRRPGLVPGVIAEVLGVSERRIRAVIQKR